MRNVLSMSSHSKNDIQYPYVDLDNYYDKIEADYNNTKYCSHLFEEYQGFTEKYRYCVYCQKTEEEIIKPK